MLKAFTTRNTISSTESSIITELLKFERSVLPKKVAACTPAKGITIPRNPKKKVIAARTLGFKKTPYEERKYRYKKVIGGEKPPKKINYLKPFLSNIFLVGLLPLIGAGEGAISLGLATGSLFGGAKSGKELTAPGLLANIFSICFRAVKLVPLFKQPPKDSTPLSYLMLAKIHLTHTYSFRKLSYSPLSFSLLDSLSSARIAIFFSAVLAFQVL